MFGKLVHVPLSVPQGTPLVLLRPISPLPRATMTNLVSFRDSRRNLLIETAIHLRWWQTRALSKAHEPPHQFRWPAADRAANNAFKMAALPSPSNLHPDSMVPARP